jgi:ribonuclease HI
MDKKVKNNDMSFYEGYFDGSAKPNPGKMTIGGFIQTSDKKVINHYSAKLGHGTNNESEYLSFIKLLDNALELGIRKIKLYGDSALVVNQVNRSWKAKDERMKAFRDEALSKLAKFHEWRLEHIKRDFNRAADSLTR